MLLTPQNIKDIVEVLNLIEEFIYDLSKRKELHNKVDLLIKNCLPTEAFCITELFNRNILFLGRLSVLSNNLLDEADVNKLLISIKNLNIEALELLITILTEQLDKNQWP